MLTIFLSYFYVVALPQQGALNPQLQMGETYSYLMLKHTFRPQ